MTAEREAELYTAVLDQLRRVGYEALTVDSVATHARCSKATIYRRWRGKPELVAKALQHARGTSLEDPDTGSLRGDLHAMLTLTDDEQIRKNATLVRALAKAVQTNPDLLKALKELLVDSEPTGLNTLLHRAIERGEIRSGYKAAQYLPHLLIGALLCRLLIEDQPIDRAFLSRYIDSVVLPSLGL
ncbi:TetR/AcrR family transcriptional regulator [Streptomyces muensis]|uniref:TetR/AcrR family transcriptional regulator n=1 Tax=Streptomyces muensis TaxID=1077944 RepID=A0A9X1PRP2_STRM4|nr:TetR/AcrR family transcriptional regulator [Streptomyces muensis]MCF1592275.1 TetR/AcrR family transcriptional regulator [Streptomyces muensis]